MIKEPFAVGSSFLHHLDPRIRIVSAFLFAVVVGSSNQFDALSVALFFSVLLIVAARINWLDLLKRLSVVAFFIFLIWIVMPLTYDGPTLFTVGPLKISKPGIVIVGQISLKTLSILLSFIALVATMSILTLGHSLNSLHVPSKFVHLMLITYRYIFVIEEEYRRLRRAAQIRGFQPKTNVHSYKTYAYMIGLLFVRASLRADRVHRAMLCRGFKGRFYSLEDFDTFHKSGLFISGLLVVILIILLLEYWCI